MRAHAARSRRHGPPNRMIAVACLAALAALAVVASLAVGASAVSPVAAVRALVAYDPTDSGQLVVRELRLPRTIVGALVGVALGTSGALMQAVTRNPLADPGLLGVNAGASFAVVVAIWSFGVTSTGGLVWFALAGAALASVAVHVLGAVGGGSTPARLALAGAALGALLFGLTRAITILDQDTLDRFRFWMVGSLAGRDLHVVRSVAAFHAVGLLLALSLVRSLDAIALGDDAAASLGVRVARTRLLAGVAVVLLCGAAVAAVGPVAFVGLMVPHAVRTVVGPGQRWMVPSCALAGAVVLLVCDTVGRVIAPPGEVQVGIVTAALGGAALVAIVRRARPVAL